jgi:hypothetical protein
MGQDHPLDMDHQPQGGQEKGENGRTGFAAGHDRDAVQIELEQHANNENQNDLLLLVVARIRDYM